MILLEISGVKMVAMDITIIKGKKTILIAIPENLPIRARLAVYSIPEMTSRLGTIKVDKAEIIVVKNPFKLKGTETTRTLNKS